MPRRCSICAPDTTVREALAHLLVGMTGWLLARLPASWAAGLGIVLGMLWHRIVPIRRGVARDNISKSLGLSPAEVRKSTARVYRHFGRSFVELLRASAGRSPPQPMTGRAHLEVALARGRGVIVVSAHLGAFELLVRAANTLPVPVHVITRRFRSVFAQALWHRLRRGGPALLPAGASAREAFAALKRNEIVVFVLDQHVPPGRAVWVPFFGRPAATDPDLARLARATGAAVVPIFTRRAGPIHPIEIQPALELDRGRGEAAIVEATARCAAVVEAAIRAAPEQWLWIHRRWKPPPPDVAQALVEGRAGRRRSFRAHAE